MTPKLFKTILALVIILGLAAGAYWYFFMRIPVDVSIEPDGNNGGGGFVPLNRQVPVTSGGSTTVSGTQNGSTTVTNTALGQAKIPTLRLLSDTPVGGYGASTTGPLNAKLASTTTTIRWVDRGRGNIFEARGNNLDIITVSNTVVPKIYESVWNKNLTSLFALGFSEDNDSVDAVFAQLRQRIIPAISTSTPAGSVETQTPYELKGKLLPYKIITYAVSPKKDKVFLLVNNSGVGIGYIVGFDGNSPVQIFTTPLTQLNAEWPTDNTIALTTKGAASERGYLYFVDLKTGVWRKILGPLPGLSTKVSNDAKRVFISVAGSSNNVLSSIYDVGKGKGEDAVIRTLADKCVWGNFYKDMVYCAVPSQPVAATYPDDWYKGSVSLVDKIWQINATTGEIHLVSSIVDTSDRVIDAFNLGLDEKDDFLIFMNKNDLSLWSLDLVSNN